MMQDGLSGSRFSDIQAPAALVISPTRELAVQIFMEARKFSYKTSLMPVVCYGGVSVAHQLRQIERGCHILVATPGRLKDFADRRKVVLLDFSCTNDTYKYIYIYIYIYTNERRYLNCIFYNIKVLDN